MPPTLNEQELVTQAQNGDEQAVSVLYESHIESIFNFISYKVDSHAIAEDLTSEVFLRMVRGLAHYKQLGIPFRAWLYRIATNLITDYYRQHGKNRTEVVLENIEGDDTDPFERVAKQEEVFRLRLAVRALPEEYQDLLILRFVEDMPHTEIAKIVNKSAPALRAMQYRALKALAQQLDLLNTTRHSLRGDEP